MTYTEKIWEIEDKVFQSVMNDIGKHYKVSDRLYDILSDSLSEHIPKAIQQAVEEDRERIIKRAEKMIETNRFAGVPYTMRKLITEVQHLPLK